MNLFHDEFGNEITPEQFEKLDRRVAKDIVGKYEVSTVFLALDHSFGQGPELLYETMVFDLEADGLDRWSDLYCHRYPTRQAAKMGHALVVEALKAGAIPESIQIDLDVYTPPAENGGEEW